MIFGINTTSDISKLLYIYCFISSPTEDKKLQRIERKAILEISLWKILMRITLTVKYHVHINWLSLFWEHLSQWRWSYRIATRPRIQPACLLIESSVHRLEDVWKYRWDYLWLSYSKWLLTEANGKIPGARNGRMLPNTSEVSQMVFTMLSKPAWLFGATLKTI